jgi:hypothetical protein
MLELLIAPKIKGMILKYAEKFGVQTKDISITFTENHVFIKVCGKQYQDKKLMDFLKDNF